MPTSQSESKSDRIQSATVDSAPARNDQESAKHCGNGDADQAAPSKETEWKAAEDAIIAYALAAYKAKLGHGQAPEALSLELLSTVSPAYPLARLSFNLTSLSQIWKFSVCRCIVGWVAEGWSVEDIYERVTRKAWEYQKATTSSAARLLAKVFKFIGKDRPIRREHEKWILLASVPFWESSLHMAILKGYEHLLGKKQGTMPKENKRVKGQPAFEPVQCMELREQPHNLREGEQMPGPERLKAEGRMDDADQLPPMEGQERRGTQKIWRPERTASTCTVTDLRAKPKEKSAPEGSLTRELMERTREQMWELLVARGFTEKKLAVFKPNDAEEIAGQVCRELGIILELSHVDVIAEWILAARRLEPIQKRLRGDHTHDPLHSAVLHDRVVSQTHASSSSQSVAGNTLDESTARPVRRAQRFEGESGERAQKEMEQKEYWSRELYRELRKIEAPALEHLEHCVEERHLHLALAGRTRYNTLKRYIKVWKSFFLWHSSVRGAGIYPEVGDLVEYIFASLDSQSCHERTACIDPRRRMGESQIVASVRDYVVEMLSKDTPPTKRAPRYPVVIMEALEHMVGGLDCKGDEHMVEDDTRRLGYRVVAWIKLVKLWGCLRWDDIQKVNPKELKYYGGRMTTILRTTKTTGPTKRVQELPVCVAEHSFISSPFWLKTGFDLLRQHATFDRDYLLPKLNEEWTGFRKVMAVYGDISSYSSRVRRKLVRPGLDIAVIHPELAAFWTEHSERATLPTGLALLQTPREERDMLGRWKPDGSDTYIRMYNGIISRLQWKFALAARGRDRSRVLDERDVVESAMSWITERCGTMEEERIDMILTHLEESLDSPMLSGWNRAEDDVEDTELATEQEHPLETEQEHPREGQPPDREIRKPQFVVVNNGSRCKRLHKSVGGCWMGREINFKPSVEFYKLPDPCEYTHYCKVCWPKSGPTAVDTDSDSSSSTSSSRSGDSSSSQNSE
eukprot:s3632_g4.t1